MDRARRKPGAPKRDRVARRGLAALFGRAVTPVEAIVLSDTTGHIRHWSDGAERLSGWTRAEAEGRSLDLIVPEAYRERHWSGFRRAMATAECKADGATSNLFVQCKDGSVRPFPARFIFLRDARNRPVGAMAIYATPSRAEEPFGPILDL
jgi:PAS domain S-box-containing protein